MSKQTDNSKLLEDKLYPLGHTDDVEYSFTAEKGLTEGLVRKISSLKEEPKWMLEIRLKAYKKYLEMMRQMGYNLPKVIKKTELLKSGDSEC